MRNPRCQRPLVVNWAIVVVLFALAILLMPLFTLSKHLQHDIHWLPTPWLQSFQWLCGYWGQRWFTSFSLSVSMSAIRWRHCILRQRRQQVNWHQSKELNRFKKKHNLKDLFKSLRLCLPVSDGDEFVWVRINWYKCLSWYFSLLAIHDTALLRLCWFIRHFTDEPSIADWHSIQTMIKINCFLRDGVSILCGLLYHTILRGLTVSLYTTDQRHSPGGTPPFQL